MIMMTVLAFAAVIPIDTRAQSHSAASIRATDTTADSDEEANSWRLRSGASAGSIHYDGGRTESAAALQLKLGYGDRAFIGVSPSFAHVTYPGVSGSAAGNFSGLTDIPVGVGIQQSFGGRFDPNLGFSASATIPVGDTTKGLGTGSVGSSFDVSAGFSPVKGVGIGGGVGHSFSDFSIRSALNGTASGWADIGAWGEVTDRLSLSGGYDRDIGPVDTAYGRSSSINAGISYKLLGETQLAVNAAHGLTGPSPLWSISVGLGTAIPSVGGGFHNAVNQLAASFGGGNHGLSKKGSSGGSGGSTTSSTRRRGRKRIGG